MSALPTPPSSDASAWDVVPGIVAKLDAEGRLLHANRGWAELFAAGASAVQGSGWQERLPSDARSALLAALGARRDFTLEARIEHPERGVVVVEWCATWRGDTGAYVCLVHDLSRSQQADRDIRAQASLFRLLADNVPALIAYYHAEDFRCRYANKGYARTFGLDEQSIIGKTFAEVIGDAAARQIWPMVEQVLNRQLPVAYERQLPAAGGTPRWIEVNLLPHVDDDTGRTVGTFVLIVDITKHRLAEIAVRESEERLAKFMQASAEGIVFHKDGFITDANPPICALIGYSLPELLGRKTLEFIAPEHVAKVAAVMAAGQETAYESALVDKHGRRIPVEFIVRTMLRNGERHRMTIVRDIRDRQAAQARIHHLAHHDALTGLPNRLAFMEQLEHQMIEARTNGTRLALLFIDLDHFKRVNDSMGHLVGDTLLHAVGARITGCLRSTDGVARFGGDEFMVLLPGVASPAHQRQHVEEVARKLLAAIEAPVQAEGPTISVTPSIGIALYPGDGDTADELVKHADSAMYRAKARGRANHQFYDPGNAGVAYAALVLEGQLTQALERGEFELHFQPQAAARDGAPVGCEALLRWNHPERGLLLPDEFIPVAEGQRLMLQIGQWALRTAARCAAKWRAEGLGVTPVAVNLSSVQFQSVGFVEAVAQVLADDAPAQAPGLIELELTERMLMDDLGEVKHRLNRLKSLGLGIAVDDFGTGYSSLGHLKELPIDKIKIDKSFVQDLPGNRDSAAITRAIVQLGASLGLKVVAEGVETEPQRAFLAGQGCDALQGLLIGPALPQAAFEAWARAQLRPDGATSSS
jgi:diguanylate cyclase (GGDEF)-like protein/PAS domain S-box-containing protein